VTSVSHNFAPVRVGIGLTGAVIILVTLLATAPSEAAAQQRGLLTIQKKITLTFPAPGVYQGEVRWGQRKVVKKAENRAGKKAAKAAMRAAKRHASSFCGSSMRKTPVQVVHLSDPPFPIGADVPKDLRYIVRGAEPPIGDPVRASQAATAQKFSVKGFKWTVRCREAHVLRLYG